MASLYQRKSDGRWIGRYKTPSGPKYVTGTDRDRVLSRVLADHPEQPVGGKAKDRPFPDRFWDKVVKTSSCWVWIGAGGGRLGEYGVFKPEPHVAFKAHRYAYELLRGPIPDGLTLDHLCRVTRCVNPDHLEPVTLAENVRRAVPYRVPA